MLGNDEEGGGGGVGVEKDRRVEMSCSPWGGERAMCISEGPQAGDSHPQGPSPPEHQAGPGPVGKPGEPCCLVWWCGGESAYEGRRGLFDFVIFLGSCKFFVNFKLSTNLEPI